LGLPDSNILQLSEEWKWVLKALKI
jgi:hypothetical protein